MYCEFYQLHRRPFLTAPDASFIYWAEPHTIAFSMLRYGVMMRAPITVVTGEIGVGKTTLLRKLIEEVPEDLTVGLVSNMQAGRGELLEWTMMALGETLHTESYVKLFARFQDLLVERYAEGKRVLLIFDEAQNLSVEALEELRMLSNINADGHDLLQLVLVGQPQLRALLNKPELKQFSQRISSDFHLGVLGAKDVERYIQHRLELAGARWRVFPHDTCQLIYAATGGVPRLVNILCELCLIYGFAAEEKTISETLTREFLDSAHRRGIYEQFSRVGVEAPLSGSVS